MKNFYKVEKTKHFENIAKIYFLVLVKINLEIKNFGLKNGKNYF